MPSSPPVRIVLFALAAFALYRVLSLLLHDPLLALANNYDQIRYTGCYDIGPVRPDVPAWHSNPQAPLRVYARQPIPEGNCYWSTDWLAGASVAAAWRVAESFGDAPEHSIRALGLLRLAGWMLVAGWVTLRLRRAGRDDLAIVHLAVLALIGADPANTLYLSTFYAEAGALFGLYVALAGALVAAVAGGRSAWSVTAIGGVLLGGSKYQHFVLPSLLALALISAGDRRLRRAALALALGGLAGGALQIHQAGRTMPMTEAIAATNRVNFVLTALLPNVADPAATVAALGLPDGCAALSGKSIYQLTEPVETLCPGLRELPVLRAWTALAVEPKAWLRAAGRAPPYLPWIPDYLGLVEGGQQQRLPDGYVTLDRWLDRQPYALLGLFALPWLVLAGAWLLRTPPLARAFAAVFAAGSAAVAAIALLGDGYVELGKHAHLAFSLALAAAAIPLGGLLARRHGATGGSGGAVAAAPAAQK
ncbi:MAG: hypothetical protein DI564_13215 [Rhodanobacter denitrificans]|uniref:Glycosyltransferase RgtA/B/C/D-like domain-containing protein n=1 Tax=Rhodanobacter denitrificans TaxID=666685 RepID=A0A2W5K9X2_9GAMM|nr:MAG: hypothetical protein DI564_13215 [Rhodanobacter denitrificans]